MLTNKWQITLREENLTLLEALSLRIPAAPRAFLRQLCKKQRVTINGDTAKAHQYVPAGGIVTVQGSERWQECLEKSRLSPEQILYEDIECMVVNKPTGLAIHYAQGQEDNLLHRVQDFLRLRKETFQVSPIHRLDIGTSGAVLFGKGRAAISQLGQMIMAGEATKHYLALVSGEGALPDELNSTVSAKGKIKEALTRIRPIASVNQYTLLELELVTGRRHQIRYQLAAVDRPIVGDKRYHGEVMNGMDRPFLHCHRLAFPPPATQQTIEISCPLPDDLWQRLLTLGFTQELRTINDL
jgi:RluA family pseudouridine synthase